MLKRYLTAVVLTVGIMFSAGAARLLAECYIDCSMVITDDYIILSCGPVWCD
jgi:hypothetical protein